MRFFAVALLLAAGCEFHVQGGAPPGGGQILGPGSPGAPGTTTGSAGNGGTGGGPGDPGDPTGGNSGTPSTPAPADMASTTVTPGDDMASTTMPPPQPPLVVHVGQACNADPDCMEPDLKCFKSIGKGAGTILLTGGYCSKVCNSKVRCPTGSECVATTDGDFCMNICPTGGCRSGYSCCTQVNACGLTQFCGGQS